MESLEAEFLIVARCCRWNFSGTGDQFELELPTDLDWNRIVTLARRHRVQGLVWNALAPLANQLPEDARAALSSDARSIAATNLAIVAECRALRDAFEQANVPILFIKGLSVGALAYRSPLLKMGWDIDILIDPRDLEKSSDILAGNGYSPALPSSRAELSAWHDRSKESVWHRSERYFIELHTQLADNPKLIPDIDVHSPHRLVEIAPSVSISTLADDELLAYLAVHGASSAWFRLKWIADFAALLAGRTSDELDRLYNRSQQLGAARTFGQALLLADRLFDALRPNPGLRQRLSSDRAMGMLYRAALRLLIHGDSDPTDRPLGTLPIHWTQLLLRRGLGFQFSELRRQSGLLMRRPH